MTSLRQWFKAANYGSGLTTYASTYVYAGRGGIIGTTLSKAVIDNNDTSRAVLSIDMLPNSDYGEKDIVVQKLLFKDSPNEFQHFLIDNDKIVNKYSKK